MFGLILKKKKKGYVLIGVIAAILLFAVGIVALTTMQEERIASFEECITAGYPVMESYPRQCRDGEGNLHVEEISYPLNPEG